MHMESDLEAPNWMVEIAPDGGSGIDEGMIRDLIGFELHFNRHGGGILHQGCN